MRSGENDKSSANMVNKSKSKNYGKSKLNKYYGHVTSHWSDKRLCYTLLLLNL